MGDAFERRSQGALALLRVIGGGAPPLVPPRKGRGAVGAVGLERRQVEGRELSAASRTAERAEVVAVGCARLADLLELAAERLRDPSAFSVVAPDGSLEVDDGPLREASAEIAALSASMVAEWAGDEEKALRERRARWALEVISMLGTQVAYRSSEILVWCARQRKDGCADGSE